jgi:cytochrome b561
MSRVLPVSTGSFTRNDAWPVTIRLIHWATLLAVIAAVGLAFGRDWVSDDDLTESMLVWHRCAGMAVLALSLLRLALRPFSPGPVHAMSPLARLASKGAHLLMYGFLIGMPVVGWLMSNAHGTAVSIGSLHLPTLLARDHDLADTLGEFHEAGAFAFMALIGLHAAAALWHHHFQKDNVLRSMWRSR